MASRTSARILSVCLSIVAFSYAQKLDAAKQSYPPTLWVPCDTQLPPNSTLTSPILVSRVGGHSAKITVKVAPEKGTCFNTTSLWITDTGPYAKQAGPTFVYRPKSDDNSGNGMNLVDWSPDGRLLLTEFWQWDQGPNDVGVDKQILLFSADGKTKLEIDTERFLADQKDKNCWLEFELLGFTPSGQVAMRTDITRYYEPAQDPSEVPPAKRCVEKHQAWAVDPHTQHREPLPSSFQVVRYSGLRM